MEGKHILIEAPAYSGTEFFSYKGTFSIVLSGVVDATYKFLYVNVGCQGCISDGGIFWSTAFHKLVEDCSLNLPQNCVLPGRGKVIPHVFVAGDVFPLSPNTMKPYGGHQEKGSKHCMFNYCLSRAQRVAENVFRISSSVFRVFQKPMLLQPQKAEKVTLACVYLHNYLRSGSSKTSYTPQGTFDMEHLKNGTIQQGSWRNDHQGFQPFRSLKVIPCKSPLQAADNRDEFAEYFMSEHGYVPWQFKHC